MNPVLNITAQCSNIVLIHLLFALTSLDTAYLWIQKNLQKYWKLFSLCDFWPILLEKE